MDKSRIKHTFTNKKLTQPFANSNSVRCCDVIHMYQTESLRFLYIYSLGRLSFKIINSPGRLFLMEERRQYKICHLLRGYIRGKQKDHQLSNISTAKPYKDLDQNEGYRVIGFMAIRIQDLKLPCTYSLINYVFPAGFKTLF